MRHPLFPAPPKKRSLWARLTENDGITLTCHAKVNLFLHIAGKRNDGYHLLQSWVAFAEVGDEIRLRAARQLYLIAEGPFARHLPPMQENLIIRTVELLARRFNKKPNVMVELTKNLPIGTGLGGGSANAAATARALQHLWGFEWTADDARWLAHEIGADVPVCLIGRPAMVQGIGDEIQLGPPLPDECHVIIVYPGVGISTAEVFSMLSPPYTPYLDINSTPTDVFDLVKQLQDTRNDLMHPAMGLQPKILEAYRALTRQTGCLLTRMTGSGTACFGIYADEATARQAAMAIRREQPEWWVRRTRLLSE